MRLQVSDSVVFIHDPTRVGIAELLDGGQVRVRLPEEGNRRDRFPRNEVRPLADAIRERRAQGASLWNGLNLTGESTLAKLVSAFGYSTERLRQETLEKVVRQLGRADLAVVSLTGGLGRDDRFRLDIRQGQVEAAPSVPDVPAPDFLVAAALPETFWPTAFGLPSHREVDFLHALMGPQPILCILQTPEDAATAAWLQPTWEGVVSWAYRSAQQFVRRPNPDYFPEVKVAPASFLRTYLQESVLDASILPLQDRPHRLALVTLHKEADLPVDFQRLRAVWPGPVFRFDPEIAGAADQGSADVKSILRCLLLVAGCAAEPSGDLCPLKTFLWSTEASARILARATTRLGDLFRDNVSEHFKGSNEGATALALKADVASWVRRRSREAALEFESHQVKEADEFGYLQKLQRIDLFVKSQGRFEVESLAGSGPMEAFYHQKVFTRVKDDAPLWLVVPNEAVLWAGPYLADIAHHLGKRGHVLIPGLEESYIELQGRPLSPEQAGFSLPLADLARLPAVGEAKPAAEPPIRLKDVAGYGDIRSRVEELIIWPEKHRGLFRRTSRSSGILFFGPPGCGKSRLAQAIAGELDQEVRLLSPSDLRGAYIGWGQILIREQFDWVAENDRRMLVIDELDAVAHSRQKHADMHTDEKANVNELLVQLDRVGRLGRLIVGTTNFIAALDEGIVRSGRFGRFIPVPPPTLDEAAEIMGYYLQALSAGDATGRQPRVEVPPRQALPHILRVVCEQNARERRLFCGADLEETVNRAYLRQLRETLAKQPPGADSSAVVIKITGQDLSAALQEVPRSVSERSVKQFLRDVDRFCGAALKKQLSESLYGNGCGA